ncbi:MAG: hypothetical protein C4567_00010 [Deltaproteobacteria bacterium]|nr:MAG: hypothetical protein C4567_00010 [Deltaproteobacteria bacterium]
MSRPRGGSGGGFPLAPLTLLIVALIVAFVDIAVFIGQDVILAPGGPHLWLGGPGPLGRSGARFGSDGLAGAAWPGAGLAGPGRQPVLIARTVIEVLPVGG